MSSETPKNSSRKKTLLTSRRTICKAAGLAGGALLVSTAKASSPHEPASPLSQDTKTVASPSRSMTLPAIPARMAAGDADSAPRSMYRLDSPAATLVLIEWQEGLPEIAHWGARLPQNIHAEDVFTAREADTAQNATDQWKPLIRQVLALYTLWDRLHAAHPTLEIESCASGGGRADWGALAHTQRIWTSDNTDALDRLRIQGGAWQFLPPEVTGTHISAVPNGITGRVFTLQFRAAVALFGHLGIELDPLELSADEREDLVQWVNLHKRLRGLLHSGDAQFGEETSDRVVRGVTAQDRSAAVFLVAQSDAGKARSAAPVRLPGLDPNRRYRVIAPPPQKLTGNNPSAANRALFEKGIVVSGAVLQEMGLTLPRLYPAQAFILECQAI